MVAGEELENTREGFVRLMWYNTERMSKNSDTIEMNLTVSFIQENGKVVAYTPALDLSTSGKNEEEAKQRFGEVVSIFFADLVENKTVEPVLSELGWKKQGAAGEWSPPHISQQSVNVSVPAFA